MHPLLFKTAAGQCWQSTTKCLQLASKIEQPLHSPISVATQPRGVTLHHIRSTIYRYRLFDFSLQETVVPNFRYDIFVCYSSKDAGIVTSVTPHLKRDGLRVF